MKVVCGTQSVIWLLRSLHTGRCPRSDLVVLYRVCLGHDGTLAAHGWYATFIIALLFMSLTENLIPKEFAHTFPLWKQNNRNFNKMLNCHRETEVQGALVLAKG